MPTIYAGTNKIKKIFIGSTAIKKVYAGTTLVWQLQTLLKTTATALSQARYGLAGARAGTYAIFGGGMCYNEARDVDELSGVVDAYSSSLVRSVCTTLIEARREAVGVSTPNYGLICGGYINTSNIPNNVDAYSDALVYTTPTLALRTGARYHSGASVGNYALITGGSQYNSSVRIATTTAYNNSLVRSDPADLSEGRRFMGSTTIGNYALFAGGNEATGLSDYSTIVDAYNGSLVRTTATALSIGRYDIGATNVGNYALFAGGLSSGGYTNSVEVYNSSLVKGTSTTITNIYNNTKAGSVKGEIAVVVNFNHLYNIVEQFDGSLLRTSAPALSASRGAFDFANTNSHLLIAGGENNNGVKMSNVDVYYLG